MVDARVFVEMALPIPYEKCPAFLALPLVGLLQNIKVTVRRAPPEAEPSGYSFVRTLKRPQMLRSGAIRGQPEGLSFRRGDVHGAASLFC